MATMNAIREGAVAVITGGASGIGLAAAKKLAALGVKVCVADVDRGEGRLLRARDAIAAHSRDGAAAVFVQETDVSQKDALIALEQSVTDRFDLGDRGVDILMNNAGIGPSTSCLAPETWERTLAVNLWGVIHGTQVFVPKMIRGAPSTAQRLVINTGSKQGITCPPGNPAYNVSKAGVKVFTEALAHELRNTKDCAVRAHLLIPGFVFTEMSGAAQPGKEKPAGAWTAEQTVDFMLESLAKNDFYILCPDNDVPRSLDERRILWAAGDIVENRPALSRWHPDFSEAFKAFASS